MQQRKDKVTRWKGTGLKVRSSTSEYSMKSSGKPKEVRKEPKEPSEDGGDTGKGFGNELKNWLFSLSSS